MMMEAGLVQQRSGTVGHASSKVVGYVNNNMKKRRMMRSSDEEQPRSPPRTVRRRRMMRRTLQELYLSCRDVFKGPGTVPSSVDVQKLCSILDNMKPEDVGLTKDLPFFRTNGAIKGTPRVTKTTIYHCNNFSLCIFFLPATAVIPLHNHPEMTVFSKLLWGTMHIKSFDWVNPSDSADDPAAPPSDQSTVRLARLKADSVFTAPCNTSVLYPTTGGNIHEFTALTPCAVLDVLGPPYSHQDGRDCSYYKDFPYATFPYGVTKEKGEEDDQRYGWLEEIAPPKNSRMDAIEYLGPQILEID